MSRAMASERNRSRRARLRDRRAIAARLEIQPRAVVEHSIAADQVPELLSSPPVWLVAEQDRRKAQVEREAMDRRRAASRQARVDDVLDGWFCELKAAGTSDEAVAIDALWGQRLRQAERRLSTEIDTCSSTGLDFAW